MSAKKPSYVRRGAAWIACHEIWLVILGVLLASASIRFALWGLGLLVGMWLIRWVGYGRPTLQTPVDWPVVILLGMGGITWWVTADQDATFLALSRLLAGVSLMYSLVNWATTRTRLLLILWGGTLSALVLALATPLLIPRQNFTPFLSWYARLPHLEDPLNPNMVAGALVMLLPFPLAGGILLLKWKLASLTKRRFSVPMVRFLQLWRMVSIPTTLVLLGGLFFTQSRGAWLATGGVGFIIGVGLTPLFLAVLLLPMLGGGWLIWQGRFMGFLDALGSGGGIVGWAQRVEIWSRALYIIQDFPFTGAGANTYSQVVSVLYPLFLVPPTTVIPHAHNLFLQVAIDLGIPGLIAFIAIVLSVFFCAARCVRHCAADPIRQAAAWAGMASLTAMLIHGLVDATTWIVGWGAPLPWLMFGLILATALHNDSDVLIDTPD
ncbi:MAG TPA: O-antigen ligase family protein [Anaerolineae bacterium]|nr:O-antigen ligase family protein [Anaerolineae bacterium]HQK12336.1 O-antigen ligase family protein [Anaerolineae bacterium]